MKATCLTTRSLTCIRLIFNYTYEETLAIGTVLLTKNESITHPSLRDDASTAEASPGRVGRGEQCYVRRGNSTSNGGPHLRLGRFRLKSRSKSDLQTAQTSGQHICTCVTTGDSPRRVDARLGSAYARNYQGCRQIEAVNATCTLKMNRF